MASSPKPYDSFWRYLRDVAVAFAIIIGGFVLAGAIAEPFRNVTALAYPAALCIGLLPFWWFTRRCQIHDCDIYDYAALSAFMLLAATLRSVLGGANQQTIETLLVALGLGVFWAGWGWMRQKLHRRSSDD